MDVAAVFLTVQDFAVLVTFHGEGNTVKNGMVEDAQNAAGDNEAADWRTVCRIAAADVAVLALSAVPVLTCTIDGDLWHITAVGADEGGMIPLELRKSKAVTVHSNQFDLTDTQGALG